MASMSNPIRKLLGTPFVAGLLVASCVFALCANDAMAQRGGGGGGRGGGGGASRGGGGGGGSHGGRQAQSSVSGSNRSGGGGSRASASSANRGGGGSANRSGNTANANRSGNTTNRTNNSNRTTNVGSNNNVNINRGDVNIDVDGGYGNGCCRARYPIAAGVTIGAIAGATAAAVGSYYYALPASGCGMVTLGGIGYYQCGSAYYQQSMSGDQVVYVSVNP